MLLQDDVLLLFTRDIFISSTMVISQLISLYIYAYILDLKKLSSWYKLVYKSAFVLLVFQCCIVSQVEAFAPNAHHKTQD